MTAGRPPAQVVIAALLGLRDMRAKAGSLWLYALASGVCAIVAFFATAFQKTFDTESVAVAADPFAAVHAVVLIFLALGLGMRAATALSWEREHRTLEVLLSGPVTVSALVGAKLATEIAMLAALNLVYSLYVGLVQPTGGGASILAGIAGYWRLSLLILPTIGLGVLVSASASTVKTAVIAFLLVVLAFAALEGATVWLNAQDPTDLSLAALYARGILGHVSDWLATVSPVSFATDLVRFATGAPAPSQERLLAALGVTAALALLSILLTRTRGAI